MFTTLPMLTQLAPTTSLSMTHATFEQKRPQIVRKKSGEVVKSALKMAIDSHDKESNKSVRFRNSLARVRSFDKLQCPLSVSGFTPLSIRALNFTSNDHLLEHMSVGLEKIIREENDVVGTVRVKNYGFQKKVVARYTFDNWSTFHLTPSTYVCSLAMFNRQDQFEFRIEIPESLRTAQAETHHCLKFAIQYNVNGEEYWDNNFGKNYSVEISPATEIKPEEANLYIPCSPDTITTTTNVTPIRKEIPLTQNDSFGSRYNFNSHFSTSNNFASTSNLSTSVSTGYLSPLKSGRSVRLSQRSTGDLVTPVCDTTSTINTNTSNTTVGSKPIFIPQGNNSYNSLCSTPPPSGFSCSPISGFGWAKAQSSWFDSITIDDFTSSSPPVHSS